MGVEYRNYLLPRDRYHVPSPARICALIERLRSDQWVLTPTSETWVAPASPHGSTGGWAEPFVENSQSPRDRWEKAVPIPIPVDDAWLAARRDASSPNPQADELSLKFPVESEGWADEGLPYPLAYGEDEPGYHDILIYAARDFLTATSPNLSCPCGAPLHYEVPRGLLASVDLEHRVRSACGACARPTTIEGSHDILFRFAILVDFAKGWPVARRAGEPTGILKAMEAAGYEVTNPPAPRQRAPEDLASSPAYDANVLRSPYGDPAPPIADAFLKVVEETLGIEIDSIPEFY